MIQIVNMIPYSLSGESSQDSEPNIAVNPAEPDRHRRDGVHPDPMGGAFAPIYVSTDGGNTWSLEHVVPGNGSVGTSATSRSPSPTRAGSSTPASSTARPINLQILRTANFASTAPMKVLVDRANEDQPWVVAGSVRREGASRDRVYIGNNDFNQPAPKTATVDLSLNAATAAAPAGFAPHQVEHRATAGRRTARRSGSRSIPTGRSMPPSSDGRAARSRT